MLGRAPIKKILKKPIIQTNTINAKTFYDQSFNDIDEDNKFIFDDGDQTFVNCTFNLSDSNIYIINKKNGTLTIQGCRFISGGEHNRGIFIESEGRLIIDSCEMVGFEFGIFCGGKSFLECKKTVFRNNKTSIYASVSIIEDNTFIKENNSISAIVLEQDIGKENILLNNIFSGYSEANKIHLYKF